MTANHGTLALDQLVDDFLERQRRGQRPTMEEYVRAHPELADQIREIFPALEVLEEFGPVGSTSPPTARPESERVPSRLGEFRILREVGRGGMGVVYEAVQESLGRHVALKVLPPGAHANPAYLERFRREAQSAARLHHTGIVPVFSVGEHDGVCYYAMQYIAGQTLAAVLQEIGRLRSLGDAALAQPASLAQSLLNQEIATTLPRASTPATPTSATDLHGGLARRSQYFRNVATIGAQVAEALAYAHAQGVVHRDVKPANLMLDLQGGVWLTDFGLARLEGSGDLTQTGDVLGTLRYAAPEQLLGKGEAVSDVYSLGITLYEMATLRPAFDDPVKARLIERVLKEEATSPGKLEPQLPRDLETIILKATAKEPRRRYQSATELAEDLRRFLADRPVKARRASRLEHAWRWCRRNRAMAALTAGLAVLIGIVIPALLLAHSLRLQDQLDKVAEAQKDEEAAKLDALDKLALSYLQQARSRRMSREVGHRFDALDAVRKAVHHTRELGLSPDRLKERLRDLRNEAIAALALPDLEVIHQRTFPPRDAIFVGINEGFDLYAVPTYDGEREGISLQRVSDGKEVSFLEADRHFGHYALSSDNRFLAALFGQPNPADMYLSVWEVGKPKPVHKLPVSAWSYAFSPDGRTLAVGNDSGRIDFFDLATWKITKQIDGPRVPRCLAYHPRGTHLAVIDRETVTVIDLSTGHASAKLTHPNPNGSLLYRVVWRPDGKHLATSDYRTGDICTWDVAGQLQPLLHIKSGQVPGVSLCYNATGECLFSNGFDGRMCMWDAATGRPILSGRNETFLRGHPRENLIGPCSTFTSLGIWRMEPTRIYRTLDDYRRTLIRDTAVLAVHPNNRLVAFGHDRGLHFYDLIAGQKIGELAFSTPTPMFEADGTLLAASASGLMRWPVEADETGRRLTLGKPVQEFAQAAIYADFSADRQTVAIANKSLLIYRRGKTSGSVQWSTTDNCSNPTLSPNGRWVAARVDPPGAIWVWDVLTGKVVKELPLGGAAVWGTARFSPDSRWLSIGAGVHRMVNTETWEDSPPRGSARIEAGTFSADGRIVAVERGEGVVGLCDVETGWEYARLTDPNAHQAHAMAFTPDGSKLVTANKSNSAVHVWDLRLLRAELAKLDLDWDAPAYPPAPPQSTEPLELITP